MRLSAFIFAENEAILCDWEAFARTLVPTANLDSLALRDHAGDLLLATVRDIESAQSELQRAERARGYDDGAPLTLRLNGASREHAIGRLGYGFNLMQLVDEYRALRASVLELWHASGPAADDLRVVDIALFNASIDTSIATAISAYTARVDESRDMFLAILSHDLRNPLSSIAMSAQVMPRVSVLDERTTGFAAQISNSASVMAKMIADLLDYTRTRLGAGMPILREPMDLGALTRDVVAEFLAGHPGRAIPLHLRGSLSGGWDPARIRQVLSNLIGNALQHGDTDLPVVVELVGDAGGVRASVRNGGVPIPAVELLRIFDPLGRGAGTTAPRSNRPGSIGLGLYIAREVVMAHGGTINVSSTAAEGTVFNFHLPAHEVPVAPTHPGASLTPGSLTPAP